MRSEGSPESVGLGVLLRAWRARAGERAGLGKPLQQVEVAAKVGVSERWYRDLERGALPKLDARTLAGLAEALRLCPDERDTLYLYAAGGEPFVTPVAAGLGPLRRLLERQPEPAYVSDQGFDVIGYNSAMAEWFPWVREPGANLVRWGLTAPQAREQLDDWPRHARAYLAMVRYALAQYPGHAGLTGLLDEALADPECRRIWEREAVIIANRDGQVFRLRLPHVALQPIEVVALVLIPAGQPALRFTVLTPDNLR